MDGWTDGGAVYLLLANKVSFCRYSPCIRLYIDPSIHSFIQAPPHETTTHNKHKSWRGVRVFMGLSCEQPFTGLRIYLLNNFMTCGR